MTRDSAAVAALDDRRRRCPVPAASDAPPDDASSPTTDGIATSGSSSNGGGGGGGGDSSPKSLSAVSTSTGSGGSSSSSSRSGSDDDDSGAAVVRPSATIGRGCPAADGPPRPTPPPVHRDATVGNRGDEESSSGCTNSEDATAADVPTRIGGRLTFYKDGQFIFQLAAHHQQQSFKNESALKSPCRWVPVPTVIQQPKNNVKNVGEWSQNQRNKTIWPYLVTSPAAPESKSPQPAQQCQPPAVRTGERKQQYQPGTTPPPVSVATCTTTAIVMAATTNVARKPSRKCSTSAAVAENADCHGQSRPPQCQPRPLSKRSQPHQHQSFVMVATRAVRAQRRLVSAHGKERRRSRKTRAEIIRRFLSMEPPSVSLERVVRNLWCRRHTTELLLRRQLSLNNGSADAADAVDAACPSAGNGKRRSSFLPPSAASLGVPAAASAAAIANSASAAGGSSPNKKCRLGQHQTVQPQQRRQPGAVDKFAKKTVPSSLAPAASNNDHSITAILSGGASGTRRAAADGVPTVGDADSRVVTGAVPAAQKIPPAQTTPAPLSLLRTLLKSPGGEAGQSPAVASANGGGGVYKHQIGRKRSAVESTAASPVPPPAGTAIDAGAAMAASPANDAAAAALTALHQLPALHHPSSVAAAAAAAAAGQLAAAGYFNVLYHQAAMAAAMAYQTHAQLPKSQPLLSPQFPPAGDGWQRQLNRRPPAAPPTEAAGRSAVAASSSASAIVAPYSSPLVAVNGGVLLPPATPSPPSPPPPPPPHLPLHPQPVHHQQQHHHHHHHRHHLQLLHHQQQQQYLTVQSSSYHQHNRRRPQGNGGQVKQRPTGSAEYGDVVDGKGAVDAVDVESSSSADCVPLNLSKNSVAENVGDSSTTATVR